MPTRKSLAFALAFLLASLRVEGGLRFEPVPLRQGADVASLAPDGATLWAATSRGVWRFSAGAWALDGLGEKSALAVAAGDGAVFASDGEKVYRRAADGSWGVEALPAGALFPGVLASGGGSVYALGLGAWRRSGGTWSTLPSPGTGLVTSAAFLGNDLVVGLSTGAVARLSGGAFTPLSGGLPPGEPITALGTLGSTLYAGTRRGLFAWSGSSWVGDAAFGVHDVRAVTGAGGVLRVGTADAGIRRQGGASWLADGGSVSSATVRAFAALGSDLFAGTAGGPVYRLSGSSWAAAGAGLAAQVVPDLAFTSRAVDCAHGDVGGVAAAVRGAGVDFLPGPASASCPTLPPDLSPPAGCGDVGAVGFQSLGAATDTLSASPCGVWAAGGGGSRFVTSGLPAGALVTLLADAPDGSVVGGTSSAGLFRLVGASWSADANGLPPNASVQAVGAPGGTLYASVVDGLYARGGTGTWAAAGTGLPDGGIVTAIGGTDAAWSGLSLGGVYRRGATGVWRRTSAGLESAAVWRLEAAGSRLAAAAGTAGVKLFREGGWAREAAGLPQGVDVRALRGASFEKGAAATATQRRLYAGTSGQGLFVSSLLPVVRTVPVVLDVVGVTGARFRTELTIGSRSTRAVTASLTFTPAPDFGAPSVPAQTAPLPLAPGREVRATDALAFLRGLGMSIPEATVAAPIAGSLSVVATHDGDDSAPGAASEEVHAIARTYTVDAGGGSYGLFYSGSSDLESAEEEASVFGLRTVSGASRSNLALVALPGRGAEPVSLSVQVHSADGAKAPAALPFVLAPGEWRQVNDVLLRAGLADGSSGYARVTRTAGTGAWTAYGVVNDARTSDGSFLAAFRPGGRGASRRQIVPVVLDVFGSSGSHFTTELTLVNRTAVGTPVDLTYRPAPGFGSAAGVPFVTVTLAAGEQRTIGDVVAFLRQNGVQIPVATVETPQAGTLSVDFRYLHGIVDEGDTFALARTTTPNPDVETGGTFGLFYPAVARGGGARTKTVVPALTTRSGFRSNLAVVHAGGGEELPITLSVALLDAASGAAVGSALSVTLQPGDWYQWSSVAAQAGVAGERDFYAVVTRTAGDDTFLAYGVVNDNSTSDGSFVEGIPGALY